MEHSDERTIVVGVDGSLASLVAARYALWQAGLRGFAVRLLYSYPMPLMDVPVGGDFTDDFRAAGQTILDEAVAALEVPPGVTVSTQVAEMMPAVLMERISRSAALMVVGQHAVAWYDRLGRGSVASPLAHHSGCPVVVVPPTWRQGQRDRGPVVVALDGEVASLTALRLALDEGALLGSEVIALHVVPAGRSAEAGVAERNVTELLAIALTNRPRTSARVVTVHGDPQRMILTAARTAAMLVVGPPHAEGLATWTRSMARRLMTDVECPMAIAPSPARMSTPARPDVLVAS